MPRCERPRSTLWARWPMNSTRVGKDLDSFKEMAEALDQQA
jgi:hypothetical protein